ncbi:TraX family protein [Enterococcus sp. DIV0800]|uniref:TraX family protein n=1 Tax=unclassified Enterococcus TaxID=2608891 RepID=UPI003D2FA448
MQKGLTGFQMKVLGVVTMVIDHIAEFFYFLGTPVWFHWIGRISAPIFLFESAEGFAYTSNRKKYMFRLLLGFWIMGIINLILNTYFKVGDSIVINNIFGTLFLGTVFMQAIDYLGLGAKGKQTRSIGKGILWLIVPIIVSVLPLVIMTTMEHGNSLVIHIFQVFTYLVPTLFITEGGFLFVLLAALFYLFHGKKGLQIGALLLIAIITLVGGNMQHPFSDNYQWMMMFTAIPIILYNGEKGRSMRSFFYYFYPAHIAIFAIISFFIQK